jgi:hypothetical protein
MKISIRIAIAIAIAAAAPAAAAFAQPTAAPEGCELHLWPAERMSSTTTGLLSGFGVAGAIADTAAHAGRDSSNRAQMISSPSSACPPAPRSSATRRRSSAGR